MDDIRDIVQIHHAVFSEICLPYLLDCLRSRKKWGRALWIHYLLDIYLWVGINGFTVCILYIEKTQRLINKSMVTQGSWRVRVQTQLGLLPLALLATGHIPQGGCALHSVCAGYPRFRHHLLQVPGSRENGCDWVARLLL